jgi:hypothetical protein
MRNRTWGRLLLVMAAGAIVQLFRTRRTSRVSRAALSARVDDKLDVSVPASDPPSWTATTGATVADRS